MDKFEEHEMNKIIPIINWFDQLIKQNVMRKKPQIVRDKLKDKIINDIWRLIDTEKEKEERKRRNKRKKQLRLK